MTLVLNFILIDSKFRQRYFNFLDAKGGLTLYKLSEIHHKTKVQRFQDNFELVKKRCREVEEKDHVRNWQPPIDGEAIMKLFGLTPSREVGVLKDAIKDAIMDGVIANDYDAAYAYAVREFQHRLGASASYEAFGRNRAFSVT